MISPSERAAWEVFYTLPAQARSVVREWLPLLGNNLRDSLLSSNVLGTGELVTPLDARRDQLRKNRKREAAEHESAHAVTARALGLEVQSARIADDNSGECVHVKGTKLQNAIVLMAPELWIGTFSRDAFPYGPTGLKADRPVVVLAAQGSGQRPPLGVALNAGVIGGDVVHACGVENVAASGVDDVLAARPVAALASNIPLGNSVGFNVVVD